MEKDETLNRTCLVATALLCLNAVQSQAQDVAKGEKAFKKCMACHAVGEDAASKVGPVLNNVLGRRAGAFEGYSYSQGMTDAGAGGLVWNEETLAVYLADPRKTVKGTKMAFGGIKKPDEVTDLIAYLKTFSQ